MDEDPIIIPVASGKGGVGKTFFTANLAIALGEMGHPTLAVDMDLGGSNLHTFLGLPNRFPGIGDYLKARSAELDELLIPTEWPNLKFLPGDGRTPLMANIPYAQKLRLIRGITSLPARYILLDLGAGTAFNTLDFFRLSYHGFVITTLEYPSIMNLLTFLKNFIFRAIKRSFVKNYTVEEILNAFSQQSMTNGTMVIEEIQRQVGAIDPLWEGIVKQLCKNYRPRIIFNMGSHPDEINVADQIDKILSNALSLEADYFGFIFHDPDIQQSIKKQINYISNYGDSPAARSIKQIARRIVKYLDYRVKNSSQLLLDNTWRFYNALGLAEGTKMGG